MALLVGLATALLRRGDPRAAYVRLMRALELDPNNPRVRKLFDEAAQAARKLDSAGS